ncbi:helix-turn-helix domain-containing protein [Pseudoalteromonas sp. OANN1]
MYKQNQPIAAIARELKLSRNTVYKAIKLKK